jgi:hypothetical protein
MGLDSECDLAIDAGDDAALRVRVRAVRDRLLGEHLGQPPERVAEEMARSHSLIRVIESLSGAGARPAAVRRHGAGMARSHRAGCSGRRSGAPGRCPDLAAQLAPTSSELGSACSWLVPAAVFCAATALFVALVL